ncbi:MAG: acyltransferase [Planctomycetales bacterium]|nr:acyltransferase [Planctomycetales bacterium]
MSNETTNPSGGQALESHSNASTTDDAQPLCDSAQTSLWQIGKHIPQLDGVRGLAILIVTLYRFSKEIPVDSTIGRALHSFFALGDRGVDLFFVLSGFLITGILLDARGTDGFFRNFFARRSLRIFPLYFLSLLLFLAATQWTGPFQGIYQQASENQFYLWTYLANVKMSIEGAWCFGYLDHFWSLAVEEHFYFIWPIIIFCCTPRTALKFALILALTSAVSRTLFAAISDNGVAPNVLSIFRFDALLIGSALAIQIRQSNGLKSLRLPALGLFPICALIGVTLTVLDKRVLAVGHTVWPVLWACVCVWLLTGSSRSLLSKFFNSPALRNLGKYSYAMYVFQSPLIPLAASIISAETLATWTGNLVLANLIYMATMFALTYGAALISWHLIEKHFLALKRWFPTSPAATKSKAESYYLGSRSVTST